MNQMAGFSLVNVAAWAVHSDVHHLQVQIAKAIFGENDIGQLEQLEQLVAEILVLP